MVCIPPLAEQSCIVTSVCVLALDSLPTAHCTGAANVDNAVLHIGAVAFINRFDSSLNGRIHFQLCVVDGVFAEVAGTHWTRTSAFFTAASMMSAWHLCLMW